MTDTQHYRDRIAELEEEVRQLRVAACGGSAALRRRFKIGPIAASILATLASGRVYLGYNLAILCCREYTDDRTIDVHILKLRRKIAPLEIKTYRGQGYALEGESLATIRSIIAGEALPPAAALTLGIAPASSLTG